ncbi:MAG: aminotransferase class IV family protein [Spirosomataceae bacterium]
MNQPIFIETVRLNNGLLSNLRYHNHRLNQTRKAHFETTEPWELSELIHLPERCQNGLFKCRVTYGLHVEKVEFEGYEPRLVQNLRLITDDSIDYPFKYQNRARLSLLFEQRGNADDVLIVKNGRITDTSYANIVFWNGLQWHTPTSCLLAGTQRARLLEEGVIWEKTIRAQDLPKYAYARIINSMLDFETTPSIPMSNIRS